MTVISGVISRGRLQLSGCRIYRGMVVINTLMTEVIKNHNTSVGTGRLEEVMHAETN